MRLECTKAVSRLRVLERGKDVVEAHVVAFEEEMSSRAKKDDKLLASLEGRVLYGFTPEPAPIVARQTFLVVPPEMFRVG